MVTYNIKVLPISKRVEGREEYIYLQVTGKNIILITISICCMVGEKRIMKIAMKNEHLGCSGLIKSYIETGSA